MNSDHCRYFYPCSNQQQTVLWPDCVSSSGVHSPNRRLLSGNDQLEVWLCSSGNEDKVCLHHGQEPDLPLWERLLARAGRSGYYRVLWRWSYVTDHPDMIFWYNSCILTALFDPLDGKMQTFQSLSGSSEFTIEARLSGGEGDASWQHSQLFRQSLTEPEESSFEILVHLEEA